MPNYQGENLLPVPLELAGSCVAEPLCIDEPVVFWATVPSALNKAVIV